MRRSTKQAVFVFASALMLSAPTLMAAAPGSDLGEMLRATESRVIHDRPTGLVRMEVASVPESDGSSSEEFTLGVRNRSYHERATGSSAIGADASVPAEKQSKGLATRHGLERNYGIGEWWNGASQTTKTATIVGGAVVFLIIFAG